MTVPAPIIKTLLPMIYLPPPQPVLNKDIRLSGDVEIHPTASLAPGVILQAAPNHRIIIGADVCIGMGVIISASQGSIRIETRAILGSGVLIIGACKIGNNACVGTAVTIFQTDIEPMKVIEPGSVLGDASRQVNIEEQPVQNEVSNSSSSKGASKTKQSKVGSNGYYSPKSQVDQTAENTKDLNQKKTTEPTPSKATTVAPEPKIAPEPVIGQVYINQLLVTLFPHKKDLDSKNKKLG
jgi:carbon dioxide concentrating mechanism protein CcmN